MRLVFENGEMAGNNRTSVAFDNAYDSYIKSERVFTGMGRDVMAAESGVVGILNGTATWKRYFFLRGYVGCVLLLFFLFYRFG